MANRSTLGKLAPERVHPGAPRFDEALLQRYRALTDLTGSISDASDTLGLQCTIPAMTLAPILAVRVIGPALTVRNVGRASQPFKAASDRDNRMGEIEAHHLAQPGDVLVIQGLIGVSNLGGQSASIGRRQGEIGAIIDGSIRDPDQYRVSGMPVWCRGFTPITGKWRLETLEVNGAVEICGIPCHPGDLVCADSAGVCIVPRALVDTVIEICERFERGDSARQADIDAGVILPDLVKRTYK
jgi:regulator of RNase E activity RraA